MQIIHELEKSPREIYTGAIGFVSQNESVFSVAIRTAVVDGDSLEMGVGSGLLYEADAGREYEECRLKGRFLTDPQVEFELLETMLWKSGHGPERIELHLDRLIASAQYFAIPITRDAVIDFLRQNEPALTGGERGLLWKARLLLARDGSLKLSFLEMDHWNDAKIRWAREPVHSRDRFLYHKTTHRERYRRELESARAAGFVEVLFRNEREEVTEGAVSNIWILQNGIYYTPPVDCGLLAGTYRRYLLESSEFRTEERVLFQQDLDSAEAIFISNAVRGLMRVSLGSFEKP
jgi:para-aminobenzoate synthetase/4-amino-4-deoxychorismate lyase